MKCVIQKQNAVMTKLIEKGLCTVVGLDRWLELKDKSGIWDIQAYEDSRYDELEKAIHEYDENKSCILYMPVSKFPSLAPVEGEYMSWDDVVDFFSLGNLKSLEFGIH